MSRPPALLARTLLLFLGLAGAGGVRSAAAPAVALRIVEPAPGAVVNAAAMAVTLSVDGVGLPADAARWPYTGTLYIALDGAEVLATSQLRFTLMGVAPGPHRLGATLAGYGAKPVRAPEVAFTARPVAPPAGASWVLGGLVALAGGVILAGLGALWLVWVRPQRLEALPAAPAPDEAPDGERN